MAKTATTTNPISARPQVFICFTAALLTMSVLAVPAAQAQDDVPLCFGQSATIVGTNANEVLVGTAGDDVIVGLGGRDIIRGLGGDDIICGGSGRDRILGGAGNDVLLGGNSRDYLSGGQGSDSLDGGNKGDVLRGGGGADVMNGRKGIDTCNGSGGPDRSGVSCETTTSSARRQTVEVDGAEVSSQFSPGELPESATRVMFQATILDAGNGPQLCLGAILTSYPPQCGGYRLVDFEMVGDWFEEASGTRWGGRRLTVSWPPVDGSLRVIHEGPSNSLGPDSPRESDYTLPETCEGLTVDTASTLEHLQAWAQNYPDRNGGIWISGQRIPVLQVTGAQDALDAARAEIATDGRIPCLEVANFSTVDRDQIIEQLRAMFDLDVGLTGFGFGKDRAFVDVAVADRNTVVQIAALVDRPDLLTISGSGTILKSAG